MAPHPLYLLFVWHMHQPYYRDPRSGVYRLPWVRLHGIKDYYDMPALLREYPAIRQTFNLVPSLVDQIDDYAAGKARDHFLDVSRKAADDLEPREKLFILKNFFLANWDTMVRPYPRYHELLRKRGGSTEGISEEVVRYFSPDDFRDLQVWFNLAWFDPMFQRSPLLRPLIEKGRGFSETEKQSVLDYQGEVLRMIVPIYREMSDAGQIELTTSPYYHPILPLVADTNVASVSMPWATLPERFSFPQDSRDQIRKALHRHERCFGSRPRGMWPSEGSVSQEIGSVFSDEGVEWIATDEAVLAGSLGRPVRDGNGMLSAPEDLYRPYRLSGGTQIIFRDHDLSDRIGFVYSRMGAEAAVQDFLDYLHGVRGRLPKDRAYAVPVILDGENAWEWFPNDGQDFLRLLYERLSSESDIRTATVSDYLAAHPADREIPHLFPASWINGNFSIWIGHEEDNAAWDHLRAARETLQRLERDQTLPRDRLEEIRRYIFIAEGSDWCWWYGDDHSTENQDEFDALYRENLKQVYRVAGEPVPRELDVSILRTGRTLVPDAEPRAFLTPVIDGEVTNYFEWLSAGRVHLTRGAGAMHEADSVGLTLFYGFDANRLFLRFPPVLSGLGSPAASGLTVDVTAPQPRRIVLDLREDVTATLSRPGNGQWVVVPSELDVAKEEIVEIAVSFQELGARPGEKLNLFLTVTDTTGEAKRFPGRGVVVITVPTEDFEALMWQ